MRLSDLEKISFAESDDLEKVALIGAALNTAANVGGGAIGLGLKGAKPLANFYANKFGKAPVSTALNTYFGYHGAKGAWDVGTGGMYAKKMQGLAPKHYGHMENLASEGMQKVGYSHPVQALKEMAGLGTEFSLPRLIASTAIPIAVGTMLAPSVKTMGEKIQRELFPVNERINAEDEMALQRVKMMGEFDTKQLVKSKEKSMKDRSVLPAMHAVVDHLKVHDPHIRAAWDDLALRPVIGQTMNTVYAFAPDIAKDQRAMQSVLREAVSSPDGGLSFQTIKHISEAQQFITRGKGGGGNG